MGRLLDDDDDDGASEETMLARLFVGFVVEDGLSNSKHSQTALLPTVAMV